jgi:hypothetical protein
MGEWCRSSSALQCKLEPVHVVAITRLGTAIEDEAKALAADLATVPYELRLKLNAGLPAIVLTTPEEGRARAFHGRLVARGHDAICCALSDVVATKDMLAPSRFRLDVDALVAVENPVGRLEWQEVAVLVQATHRTTTKTTKWVRERAAPVINPSAPRAHTTTVKGIVNEQDEGVLYIFPRTGPPWSLRQLRARFDALGDEATPSATRNFVLAVEQVRMRARQATFDDRLWRRKGTPTETDLLAHLIAQSPVAASPFR